MSKRMVGTIKWYNTTKGYGFIGCEGGDDVFVHASAIVKNGYHRIEKGQRVEFILEETPKGLQAASVILR